jgi:hypothetical protein
VSAAVVASILGDHYDMERGKIRAFAQCIAYPNNLTSVVIEPEKGILWLGEGPAPMCDSDFKKVKLWEQNEGACGERLSLSPQLNQAQREGLKAYVRGVISWQNRRDPVGASQAMRQAVQNDPEDPAYRLMDGLFRMQNQDWKGAAESFEAGASFPDLPHRSATQRYWRGRAMDILGKRSEAVALYNDALAQSTFKPLRQAAEKGLHRPQKPNRRMIPDLAHADAHAY